MYEKMGRIVTAFDRALLRLQNEGNPDDVEATTSSEINDNEEHDDGDPPDE